jgi:HEPN domain-containing protein
MPDKDPSHWLYRFTSDEWLRAGAHELIHAKRAFLRKSQREAVAHSRRAAGMAVNAILWHKPDEAYGRSFMDHLASLTQDAEVPEPIRQAAQSLIGMSMQQQLVTLGRQGDAKQAEPAERILQWAQQVVAGHLNAN